MTIKSIIYSAMIIIGLIILIEVGISLKDKLDDAQFKIIHSQVEGLK
jgi:hypothetical protein